AGEHMMEAGLGDDFDPAAADAVRESNAAVHAGFIDRIAPDEFVATEIARGETLPIRNLLSVDATPARDIEINWTPLVGVKDGIESEGPEALAAIVCAGAIQRAAIDAELVVHRVHHQTDIFTGD